MSAHGSHPHALIAVANGSEDIETVTTLDVLRRAGIIVRDRTITGVDGLSSMFRV